LLSAEEKNPINESGMYSEDEDAKLKSEVIVNPVNKRRQRTRGNPIAKYF